MISPVGYSDTGESFGLSPKELATISKELNAQHEMGLYHLIIDVSDCLADLVRDNIDRDVTNDEINARAIRVLFMVRALLRQYEDLENEASTELS